MAGYRLIQFLAHPVYAVPVNVGVLVWSGHEAHLKMLGVEADAPFRSHIYRQLAAHHPVADEVLQEWAAWFLAISEDPRRLGEEGQLRLDELAESGGSFSCANYGRIDSVEEGLSLVVDDLFQKCVLSNPMIRRLVLQDRLHQILEEAGLDGLADAVADAEVELVPKKGLGSGLLYFPWFYLGDSVKAAIKLVDFDDDAVSVVQQLADAMGAFETAVCRKALSSEECVVVVSGDASEFRQHMKWLQSRAIVLDIADQPRTISFFKRLLAKNGL